MGNMNFCSDDLPHPAPRFSYCLPTSGSSSSSNPDQLSTDDNEWTAYENKQFEIALAELHLDPPDVFEKIASRVPGKTIEQIEKHYQMLVNDLAFINSGGFPIPDYHVDSISTSSVHDEDQEPIINNDSTHHQAADSSDHQKQSLKRKGQADDQKQTNRKKAIPWTEEEHSLFLTGLEKHGKGDWRNISRNYVKTRTPTQVASHAQKYFIRLNHKAAAGINNSGPTCRDRRRLSINDIRKFHHQTNSHTTTTTTTASSTFTISSSSSTFEYGSGSGTARSTKYKPIAPAPPAYYPTSAVSPPPIPPFIGSRYRNSSTLHSTSSSSSFMSSSSRAASFTVPNYMQPQQQQQHHQYSAAALHEHPLDANYYGVDNNDISNMNYHETRSTSSNIGWTGVDELLNSLIVNDPGYENQYHDIADHPSCCFAAPHDHDDDDDQYDPDPGRQSTANINPHQI